jgi:hypothetical protein
MLKALSNFITVYFKRSADDELMLYLSAFEIVPLAEPFFRMEYFPKPHPFIELVI